MATTATTTTTPANWKLKDSVIQYGNGSAVVLMENMGANETFLFELTTPTGQKTTHSITADEHGMGSLEIYILSGVGIYKFSVLADKCTKDISCYNLPTLELLVGKCKVSDVVDTLELFTSHTRISTGATVELYVSGKPNKVFLVNKSTTAVSEVLSGITDGNGIGKLDVQITSLSTTFIATQDTLVSNSVHVEKAADINAPANHVSTSELLKFSTLHTTANYTQNTVLPLVMQVQNTSEDTIRISLTDTSGDLHFDLPPHMELEPIASGVTREFVFFVYGSHSEQEVKQMEVVLRGEYTREHMDDKVKWAHAMAVNMPPRKLATGLAVTSVLMIPATIRVGESAKLEVEITNYGESTIRDIHLAPEQFEDTQGTLQFSGVVLPAGESYKTGTYIKPLDAGTYTYTIDGSLISGTSQGISVVGEDAITTNLLVLKK